MQGDQLLQEWKQAKEICNKIIDISIKGNIFKKSEGKQNAQEFMKVYEYLSHYAVWCTGCAPTVKLNKPGSSWSTKTIRIC